MDNVAPDVRARTMRAVPSRDSAPEIALRAALREQGMRGYRVHPTDVPGHPDLAYTGLKLALFVDGCFWHGCPEHCRQPSSNTGYWSRKLDRNIARDAATSEALRAEGWTVLRVWEHEVKRDATAAAQKVAHVLYAVREQRETYGAQRQPTQ